jgi:hypothetical protein
MQYKIQNINVQELTEENLCEYTKGGWEVINVSPKYGTVEGYNHENRKNVLSYSLVLKK